MIPEVRIFTGQGEVGRMMEISELERNLMDFAN